MAPEVPEAALPCRSSSSSVMPRRDRDGTGCCVTRDTVVARPSNRSMLNRGDAPLAEPSRTPWLSSLLIWLSLSFAPPPSLGACVASPSERNNNRSGGGGRSWNDTTAELDSRLSALGGDASRAMYDLGLGDGLPIVAMKSTADKRGLEH